MSIAPDKLPLRRGSKGADVIELQHALNKQGERLIADGDFGYNTFMAVKRFQGARRLVVDGVVGPATAAALGLLAATAPAPTAPAPLSPAAPGAGLARLIPPDWLSPVKMSGIVVHWTAGAYEANGTDKDSYHLLIEGDGDLERGNHTIADNVNTADDDYAAHTRGHNTGQIGVSLCCMGGKEVTPVNFGAFPMKKLQWDILVQVCAELCIFYKIPVTNRTLLSHAEVQGTLGIPQKQKWDYTVLPFDPTIKGATAIGDRLRREVAARMQVM